MHDGDGSGRHAQSSGIDSMLGSNDQQPQAAQQQPHLKQHQQAIARPSRTSNTPAALDGGPTEDGKHFHQKSSHRPHYLTSRVATRPWGPPWSRAKPAHNTPPG